MIGANSIIVKVKVLNEESKKKVTVLIQADKNYGVCDIILPQAGRQPKELLSRDPKAVEAYKAALDAYKAYTATIAEQRQAILNCVKGRQVNDERVIDYIKSLVYLTINNID